MLTFHVPLMWLVVMLQKFFVKLLSSVFLCTYLVDSKAFLEVPLHVICPSFYLELTYY